MAQMFKPNPRCALAFLALFATMMVAAFAADKGKLSAGSFIAARLVMKQKFEKTLFPQPSQPQPSSWWPEWANPVKWFSPQGADISNDVPIHNEGKEVHISESNVNDFVAAVKSAYRAAMKPVQSAYAYGDPEVCCVWDRVANAFQKIDIYGPFSSLCLDTDGTIAAIEFVGTCDHDGGRCQTKDAYYVSEVWRFEFAQGIFKYKDVRSTIGGNNRHQFCEAEWSMIPTTTTKPNDDWLQTFTDGRSFFVWQEEPHAAIEGPSGEFITKMFSEEGVTQMSEFNDKLDGAHELIKNAMTILQYDLSDDDHHSRRDLAYYTLVTSYMLSMKKLASGPK